MGWIQIFDEETGEERFLKNVDEAIRFCTITLDSFDSLEEETLYQKDKFSARRLLTSRCLLDPDRYPSSILSDPHPDGLYSSAMKTKEGVSGVLGEEDREVAKLVHFKLHETGKLADRKNLELVRLATVDAPANHTYGLYPLLLKQIAWEVEQGFPLHPYIKGFLASHLRGSIKPPKMKKRANYHRDKLLNDLAWKIKDDLGINISRNDEGGGTVCAQDILAEAISQTEKVAKAVYTGRADKTITIKHLKRIIKANDPNHHFEGFPVIGKDLPDFLGVQNK